MNNFIISVLCFIQLLLLSCENNSPANKSADIIALINGEKIYTEEIDKKLDKKLYDVLFEVYLMRKAKVDEVINEKIIEMVSAKYNMLPENLIDSVIYKNISDLKLQKFAKSRRYDVIGIPVLNNVMENVSVNSVHGRQILMEKYKEYLLTNFLDSVKKNCDIKINLHPPSMPLVNMNGIEAQYRGKLNSKVTFWELSDFECNVCKDAKPIYNRIYEKYKDKVKFAFSYYSGDVTFSSLALECSNRQNKFWLMYDSLSNLKYIPGEERIISLGKNIGMDMNKFKNDLKDSLLYKTIIQNIKRINEKGFYGTPTIVVNNKVILDAFSETAIEAIINDELSKKD